MKACTTMNESRSNFAICRDGNRVYVAGGRNGHKTMTDRVERYDSDKDRWVEV